MTLTFVDSGVLIAAFRSGGETGRRALTLLDDPGREFASSPFVRLEVLPKPVYFGRRDEAEFYRMFFAQVSVWAGSVSIVMPLVAS